jgi:hypothetical protein
MKFYKFEQYNNFGDTLKLSLFAENKEQAKKVIKNWIEDNTASNEILKDQAITEFNRLVEYEKNREKTPLDSDDYKFLSIFGERDRYSLIDIENNREEILNKYVENKLQRSYIWFFINMPYKLEEIEIQKGIVDNTFVYCGI